MKKIASGACRLYGLEVDDAEIKKIACDPRFQEGVSSVISGD